MEFMKPSRGAEVLPFDYSVENHFKAMDMITRLCGGEEEGTGVEDGEIARLSSSVKFLREWRFFDYEPRIVKFSSESGSAEYEDAPCSISLPQFSSSTVPEMQEKKHEGNAPAEGRKDFVIYVGGPVWALDWCPRIDTSSDCHINQEFIAVAARPPGSSYHKIGHPLIGRGIVQIWSLLNVLGKDEVAPFVRKKQKRKKAAVIKEKPTQPKRPRGRPRKKPLVEPPCDNYSNNSQADQALAIQCPEKSLALTIVEVAETAQVPDAEQDSSRKQNSHNEVAASLADTRSPTQIEENAENSCSLMIQSGSREELAAQKSMDDDSLDISPVASNFPKDVALPRLVLALAHNGKVAWDVKWRPTYNTEESKQSGRMGYLAVVLGDGSVEVWEIPMPGTMKLIYSCVKKDGTDPRFVKMEPVFRCSKITSGGLQSLPLIVEWSPSSLQMEYLIAGCHDGTVALWKFSASDAPKDTRPLLCFTADTFPIRALSWAPNGSDPESASVIVTAGQGGIKFWDIRDPFRPLWNLHFGANNIYSLDWPKDPRCVIFSFDDGTLKFVSLLQAANDLQFFGKPYVVTKQPGVHTFECSSYPTWSVHVSPSTGMVAYSSADGSVNHFELTSKAVDKSHSRHRSPHFQCVSVTAVEDDSAIILNATQSNTPIPPKKTKNVNQEKKTDMGKNSKAAEPDDEPLAICYEGGVNESEEPAATSVKSKSQRSRESAAAKKVQAGDGGQLLLVGSKDREKRVTVEAKRATGAGTNTLPPKIVAMHRVRWNLNKGSERWLCSGGAAGIVRCQEIRFID